MDDLIDIINDLQEISSDNGETFTLDLPQIVVTGSQSSGKSSVLESIVGRDFLPKGTGIVTRCPLILQLIYTNCPAEYGKFSHRNNTIFYDFEDIRNEIIRRTDELTGKKIEIEKTPIILKIYSKKVLTLTLVDLPGLTEINTKGQSRDIVKKIEELTLEYITPTNVIIVAVLPAVQEIENSSVLKLISAVDVDYERTIGVITKVDLVDDKTACKKIIQNQRVKLQKGWVMVKNRGQKDIIDQKNIELSREDENAFFEKNYPQICVKCGTLYLRRLLQEELKVKISACIPAIIQAVRIELDKTINETNGEIMFDTTNIESGLVLTKICQTFSLKINEALGVYQRNVDLEELSIGVRINEMLNVNFNKKIEEAFKNTRKFRKRVIIGLENSMGINGYIEVPDKNIITNIRIYMTNLMECIHSTIEDIHHHIKLCINICLEKLKYYLNMRNAMDNVIKNKIEESVLTTKKKVNLFMEMFLCSVNFTSKEFLEKEWGIFEKNTNILVNGEYIRTEVNIPNLKEKMPYLFDIIMIVDDTTISFYKKGYEVQRIICFSIHDCRLKFKKFAFNQHIFRIKSVTRESYIFMDYEFFDVEVETEIELEHWKKIFVMKGIIHKELTMQYEAEGIGKEEKYKMIQVEKIITIVESYVTQSRNMMQDISQKIIMKSLIYDFEEFCTFKLSTALGKAYEMDHLLKMGDEGAQMLLEKLKAQENIARKYDNLISLQQKFDIKKVIEPLNFSDSTVKENTTENDGETTSIDHTPVPTQKRHDKIKKDNKLKKYYLNKTIKNGSSSDIEKSSITKNIKRKK